MKGPFVLQSPGKNFDHKVREGLGRRQPGSLTALHAKGGRIPWPWGAPGRRRGTAGRLWRWSAYRALWEELTLGGCWRLYSGIPFLSPMFELFVVSTLSKFVEGKPRGAEFCIQACAVTSQPGREAEFSGMAGDFQQGSEILPHACPPPPALPETQCHRCQSGPGSGRCCRLPGQYSACCPGTPGSAPMRSAPGQRSESGSPCGSSSRSWEQLRTGVRSWRPSRQAL